jgi:hypothetical protein
LREHRLEHCEHRLGGLLCSLITDQIGELVPTSTNGPHITTEVIHEDLRRVRGSAHDHAHLHLVPGHLFIVFKEILEPLHNPDVFHVHNGLIGHSPFEHGPV